MATKVLDSHALLAFFQGEQAALYKASGKLAYADAFAQHGEDEFEIVHVIPQILAF